MMACPRSEETEGDAQTRGPPTYTVTPPTRVFFCPIVNNGDIVPVGRLKASLSAVYVEGGVRLRYQRSEYAAPPAWRVRTGPCPGTARRSTWR